MNTPTDNLQDQAAAFQKIWTDSLSGIMQAAFTTSPGTPPPEVLQHIRGGIFHALAESWDQFMRSPQFLESMRQWMESAITFRKLSNDAMTQCQHQVQATARDDIDTIMLTVRHLEKRLLGRVDELSAQVAELNQRLTQIQTSRADAPKKAGKGSTSRLSEKPNPGAQPTPSP